MRILLLAQFYPPDIGGEERHVHNLAVGLYGLGHHVEVMTSHLPGTPMGRSFEDGVTVHRVVSSAQRVPGLHGARTRPHALPVADPAMARSIERVLADGAFDVVHAHNWIVNSALRVARDRFVPLVLTLHDYGHVCAVKRLMRDGAPCAGPAPVQCVHCAASHYGPVSGPIIAGANAFERRARERLVSAFVAVSRSVAERNELERSDVDFEVISNFVPDDLLVKEPSPNLEGPILYLGDLTPDKGAPVLLEAYQRLDAPPELHLVGRPTSGPMALPPGASAFAARPHKEAMELVRRARLVVVPSVVPDSCPTVVLEAMAAGRAIVASATGGIVDMIEDGVSGLLVQPASPEQLADGIERILSDPDLARRLGDGARRSVESFTSKAVLRRLEHLYRRLAAEASRPITYSLRSR